MTQPQVVLITGASSGIGKATVARFAKAGWRVVATARTPEAHQDWADALGVELMRLDVTRADDIAAVVAHVQATYGQIDALVNNAGYGLVGALEDTPLEAWRQQFETNVFGPVALMQAVLPGMRARRSGCIVNVSSIMGRMSSPLNAAYVGTKWAVEGISESLAVELMHYNIRLRVVAPGGVNTGFTDALQIHNGTYYRPLLDRLLRMYRGFKFPGPGPVAEAIFKAATGRSAAFRVSVVPGPVVFLYKSLGIRGWQRFMYRKLAKA